MSQQQINQTMVILGYKQCYPLTSAVPADVVIHIEPGGNFGDCPLKRAPICKELGGVKSNPLKELFGDWIAVLVGIQYIGAVSEEYLRQGRNEATTIWTRNQQRC